MLQEVFTNQLALDCAQAAATTVLALLVMLLARQREIHLERETVVALMRGIVQIIAVGSIFLLLLRGPAWRASRGRGGKQQGQLGKLQNSSALQREMLSASPGS